MRPTYRGEANDLFNARVRLNNNNADPIFCVQDQEPNEILNSLQNQFETTKLLSHLFSNLNVRTFPSNFRVMV